MKEREKCRMRNTNGTIVPTSLTQTTMLTTSHVAGKTKKNTTITIMTMTMITDLNEYIENQI